MPEAPKDDQKPPSRPSRQINMWDHVYGGTQLAVSVLLGFYAGFWLDGKLGWSPWLTLVGSALGVAAGLYSFLVPFFRRDSK